MSGRPCKLTLHRCSPRTLSLASQLNLAPPLRLSVRVSALDQVDGIERAVDRVMSLEEEAGQRHHLAATVGRQPPDDQGHRQVQEHPESPAPGDEKKKRNEHDRGLEYARANPGMQVGEHSCTRYPEEDDVQDRSQNQTASYLAEKRHGWSHLRHRLSERNEYEQAKH